MSQCGSDGCGKASIPVADLQNSNLSVLPSGTSIFLTFPDRGSLQLALPPAKPPWILSGFRNNFRAFLKSATDLIFCVLQFGPLPFPPAPDSTAIQPPTPLSGGTEKEEIDMKVFPRALLAVLTFVSVASVAAAQTIPTGTFKHIIIVIQENRTPDNLFGYWATGSRKVPTARPRPNHSLALTSTTGAKALPPSAA